MEDKWKRQCLICQAIWGNPNGKLIKTFCARCLREIRNGKYLAEWDSEKKRRQQDAITAGKKAVA